MSDMLTLRVENGDRKIVVVFNGDEEMRRGEYTEEQYVARERREILKPFFNMSEGCC